MAADLLVFITNYPKHIIRLKFISSTRHLFGKGHFKKSKNDMRVKSMIVIKSYKLGFVFKLELLALIIENFV